MDKKHWYVTYCPNLHPMVFNWDTYLFSCLTCGHQQSPTDEDWDEISILPEYAVQEDL